MRRHIFTSLPALNLVHDNNNSKLGTNIPLYGVVLLLLPIALPSSLVVVCLAIS